MTKPRKSEPTFTSDSFHVFSKASATIIIFRTEFVDYAPKIKHKISLSPHLNQIERFLAKDISAAVVINAMPAVHRRHQLVCSPHQKLGMFREGIWKLQLMYN